MRRWTMLAAGLGTVLVASLTACGSSGDGPQAGPSGPPTTATPTPSATTPPATTPPATTAPPAEPSPPGTEQPGTEEPGTEQPGTELLRRGDSGAAVEQVQRRLRELDYWVGEVDGEFGDLTEQAVFAIQKAAGADRDGVVGPMTREALDEGARPSARSEDGRLVEVDLDRQLMMLVEDGTVEQIFNTSTGTFEHYTHDGQRYLADTPRGRWEIGWQVDDWDPGPLGRLYRPKYFHGDGIAVHGYPEVPPYPASHGCVRVSITAMDWLWRTDQLPIGTTVWVY